MKFTDGRWMLRPGVQAFHPVQVLDAEAGPGTLTVRATVVPVRHRGDLLKGPMITLTLSAPAPDVIAVNVTHLTGQAYRPPAFAIESADTVLAGDTAPAEARSFRDGEWAVLTSGELSARVRVGADWRLEFRAGGRLLTASEAGAAAIVTTADERALPARAAQPRPRTPPCTGSASGSARWSRTARWSTSGTPTGEPAASRRTRTSRSA